MMTDFRSMHCTPNGARLHARVGGSGPPLLLLHGHPQTSAMWHRAWRALAHKTSKAAPLRCCCRAHCAVAGQPPVWRWAVWQWDSAPISV